MWFHSARRRSRSGMFPALESLESRIVPAAVVVNPPAGDVSEAGDTFQFQVVLDAQPTSEVTIPVSSSDKSEGTVNVKQLVFTSQNWNQAQTVTVKGVADSLVDGDIAFQVKLGKVKSKDKQYAKQDPTDVTVTNRDRNRIGVIVVPGPNNQTTETGGTATFTLKLASQPKKTVLIPISSSNVQEGTSPNSLIFSKSNWNQPQTVTTRGVNDFIADGDQPYQIRLGPTQSSDTQYNGLVFDPLNFINRDDDVPGISVVPPAGITTLIINEGGQKSLSVHLHSQPTSNVTITVALTGLAGQAVTNPTELVFTPTNWTAPKVVNIQGLAGDGVDGDHSGSVLLTSTSLDPNYNTSIPGPNVTIHDVDVEPENFDGTYVGSYDGNVSGFGFESPVSGIVRFTVSGNSVTVIEPGPGSGTLSDDEGSFSTTVGGLEGTTFAGLFVRHPDGSVTASGGWQASISGVTGSGTWSASRQQ